MALSRLKTFRVNKKKANHDGNAIESILKQAEVEDELSPLLLKVMIEQYLWAEPNEREIDRGVWVERVRRRNEFDYFPPAEKISELLFKK